MNVSLFALCLAPVLYLGRTLHCSGHLLGVSSNSLLCCPLPMQTQANPFASAGLRPEEPHPAGCNGSKHVKASQTQGYGESSAFSLPQLPVTLEGVEASEKAAAEPGFQLLKCQGPGLGARGAHVEAQLCKPLH